MQAQTLYRALLRLYPAAFRHGYGSQMLLMFSEQLAEARRSAGGPGRAALWMSALRDAVTIGPREHGHVVLLDLRYALRLLGKSPGFASVAIVSLALGLGANTAIFGLWNGVLHSPLPGVERPEQLVMLTDPDQTGSWTGRWDGRDDGPRAWLSHGEFEQLREQAGFSAMMASQSSLNDWQVRYQGRDWEEATGRLVSGGFFDVLGVNPALGRLFTEAEDHSDSPVAVVSHSYWQRRFGGAAVLGTTFTLRQTLLTIVGVAPPGFVGETSGQRPDLWLPLRMQPRVLPGRDRLHDSPPDKVMWLHVFARLKPGVTLPQAEAQANAVFQASLESFYGSAAMGERRQEFLDQRIRIQSGARGASRTRRQFSSSLTALLAAVAVLLLIACANLANLLLARGAARRPEIALRAALGAGRERLIRQLLTESLALAALGGIAALAVAYVLHGVLVRMLAASDPSFRMGFALDPSLRVFLMAATLSAALLFGLLPAWQATRVDAGAVLKEQSRGAVGSFGRMRSARFLVAVQLALSLPLLVGAGLLARTVYNLQRADLGFSRDRLLLVRVDLREKRAEPAPGDGLLDELLGRIQRVPGVQAASYSQLGLFSGGESASTIEVEGHPPQGDPEHSSALDFVGPAYFSTLGIPVRLGRDIHENDRGPAPNVCVINEAFARRFFAGRNPLGGRVTEVGDENRRISHTVVGVARDARTQSLRDEVKPRYFLPGQQHPDSSEIPTFLIRTSGETGAVLERVREAIQGLDPSLPILWASSLEEKLAPATAQDRATARLALVFGCVALFLSAIGLYGVLAYGVARRTGEIAVRIALGAQAGQVVRMILGETSVLVGAGLAMGGGLAFVAARLIDSRLYGVAPHDPSILGLAAGVLLLVALGAAYVPARRASRLDPMVALRRV